MRSTEPIQIPDRTTAAAARTPTVLHTDKDGEFLVMRDDGTHGKVVPGRVLQAEGLAGSFWARITSKRDYRVGAIAGGVVAVVGVRFEPLTAEEAEQELARQLAAAVERERNRPLIGNRPPVKPDRRSQAEREAAGDDSPREPAAEREPFGRPIGAQREPASGATSRQLRGTRPTGLANQEGRGTGPASRASAPADRDITFYR